MTTKKAKSDSVAKARPIFDVAPPGSLTNSPTARPIIVTNRPLMQDPMMIDPAQVAKSPVLAPETKVPVVPKPVQPITPVEPEPVKATGPAPKESNETESTEVGDANMLQAKSAAAAAEAKLLAEVSESIEQKEFTLPINAVEQRRSRKVFILGSILILLLAACWLNVALDAGFITVDGIKPLTHFFNG